MNSSDGDVSILSLASNQLLIGTRFSTTLHVYRTSGAYVTSVTLPSNETIVDAQWTPRDHNIVCITQESSKIVVMSVTGDVIAQTNSMLPCKFSVSVRDVIYLADSEAGVYRSTDDGMTWSHVFRPTNQSWHCDQVILMTSEADDRQTYDFYWTRELRTVTLNRYSCNLRVYSVDRTRRRADGLGYHATGRDVTLPEFVIFCESMLAYDGHANVFLIHISSVFAAVHVLTTSGQYSHRLLSGYSFADFGPPYCLVVDRSRVDRGTMYVGQHRVVGVFALTYE